MAERWRGRLFVATLVSAMAISAARPGASPLAAPVVLNDDGGWCWFQDERALVVGDRLVFGSVAAGRRDGSRRGTVEATSVELATGAVTRFRLSATPVERAGRYDDHDTPAFVVRGDGRLVAVWAGHGHDNRILSRVSLRARRRDRLGRRARVRAEPFLERHLLEPAPARGRARPHLRLLPRPRQPLQAVGGLVRRRGRELQERAAS